MSEQADISGYVYKDAELSPSHSYLLPSLKESLLKLGGQKRLFELGCGNGSVAAELSELGWDVTGVDFQVTRVGRVPALAKSMILTCRKP